MVTFQNAWREIFFFFCILLKNGEVPACDTSRKTQNAHTHSALFDDLAQSVGRANCNSWQIYCGSKIVTFVQSMAWLFSCCARQKPAIRSPARLFVMANGQTTGTDLLMNAVNVKKTSICGICSWTRGVQRDNVQFLHNLSSLRICTLYDEDRRRAARWFCQHKLVHRRNGVKGMSHCICTRSPAPPHRNTPLQTQTHYGMAHSASHKLNSFFSFFLTQKVGVPRWNTKLGRNVEALTDWHFNGQKRSAIQKEILAWTLPLQTVFV